nr:expressed protein [Hymenolepis microstoma]
MSTLMGREPQEDKCTSGDFRAAVLQIRPWLLCHESTSVFSDLRIRLLSDCINSQPIAKNELLRIDILCPKEIGHETGPLATGLLLCAPLLGKHSASAIELFL